MDNGLALIAILSLGMIAFVFGAVGILKYGFSKLNEKNSKETTAVLVGFREYNPAHRRYHYYDDYTENGKGRLPLLKMDIDGETVTVDAAISDYDLTGDDIGKTLKVRYRRGIALVVVVDDKISIQSYNKLQSILFWTLESIAIILVVLTVIAGLTLPNILNNII